MSKPVMISVSGIRGIVGEGLTPELLVNYAAAAGTFMGKGKVLVGRDSRVTGEMVKRAVFCGLQSVGCSPLDLGICPTPTVELAVQDSDALGGIVITASHNPIEWNALKLLNSRGLFLDQKEGEKIKGIISSQNYSYSRWNNIGNPGLYEEAIQEHIRKILNLKYINLENIRKRKFKVAYDCVNGAGGTILPQLLAELGCESYPLNQEVTGRFAHNPEPVPQNLKQLSTWVRKKKADIGFAVDPDVDRLAIVAENGKPIGEEYTLALVSRFILARIKSPVVINLSTTRAVEKVAEQAGVKCFRTPVGEIHVAKKMLAVKSLIGGEGNGGVILPEIHPGRDAPVALALTLQALLEEGGTVSKLYTLLPQYVMIKKKIGIGKKDPDLILKKLIKNHQQEQLNLTDGVRIDRSTSWAHIRKSNTEPVMRVVTEAVTKDQSEALSSAILKEINKM
ncbi:MAG: phosphoglucosamine mutase [bacterium]